MVQQKVPLFSYFYFSSGKMDPAGLLTQSLMLIVNQGTIQFFFVSETYGFI